MTLALLEGVEFTICSDIGGEHFLKKLLFVIFTLLGVQFTMCNDIGGEHFQKGCFLLRSNLSRSFSGCF